LVAWLRAHTAERTGLRHSDPPANVAIGQEGLLPGRRRVLTLILVHHLPGHMEAVILPRVMILPPTTTTMTITMAPS